ncbi:MAG: molybdenum cofactor biosynthesis protein MoaE [bacterium JZ-2024 1]
MTSSPLFRIDIMRQRIETEKICEEIVHPAFGALLTFQGVVRNHTEGKPVIWVDYEAYEPLAVRQMESIARQLEKKWGIQRLALVHRLGRLYPGEVSLLIALATIHRAEGFEALAFALEQVKTIVPIWKKEYFTSENSAWVKGRPFQWK